MCGASYRRTPQGAREMIVFSGLLRWLTRFMKYFSDFSIRCWEGCFSMELANPTRGQEGLNYIAQISAAHMRLDADDPIAFCGARRLDFSVRFILLVALPCLWHNTLGFRSVNAIWQLYVVPPLNINATRIYTA
jgi:hypothetical protein